MGLMLFRVFAASTINQALVHANHATVNTSILVDDRGSDHRVLPFSDVIVNRIVSTLLIIHI